MRAAYNKSNATSGADGSYVSSVSAFTSSGSGLTNNTEQKYKSSALIYKFISGCRADTAANTPPAAILGRYMPFFMNNIQLFKLYVFLVLLIPVNSFSQEQIKFQEESKTDPKSSKSTAISCKNSKGVFDSLKVPIVKINEHIIFAKTSETLEFINPDNIEKLHVISTSDSLVKIYGRTARNGLIIVTYKKSASLFSLNEILERFDINKCDQDLNVCVNKKLIKQPNQFLFDPTTHFSIQIIYGKYRIDEREINSPERFINITTSLK